MFLNCAPTDILRDTQASASVQADVSRAQRLACMPPLTVQRVSAQTGVSLTVQRVSAQTGVSLTVQRVSAQAGVSPRVSAQAGVP
jgi:hypothetical protein